MSNPQETNPVVPFGSNYTVTLKLGFLIQVIVIIISTTLLYAAGKGDAKKAMDMGQQAIDTTKAHEVLLNDMNNRIMRIETRQSDFQLMYERDANKYIRDFNDRYNKLQETK